MPSAVEIDRRPPRAPRPAPRAPRPAPRPRAPLRLRSRLRLQRASRTRSLARRCLGS